MNGSLPKGSVRRVARGDEASPKSALAALRQTVEAFNERLRQQFAQTPPSPNETRLAIFTAGLPGAGKSTLVRKRYGQDEKYRIVDPDIIAETCAVPYDPEYPQPAHEQTREIAEAKFKEALGGKRPHVIIDTTGSKADKLIRRMETARSAGFRIRLLYVTIPIDLSLSRNRLRERHVPEHIIYEKAAEINEAFEKVRAHADEVEVVDNTKLPNPNQQSALDRLAIEMVWEVAKPFFPKPVATPRRSELDECAADLAGFRSRGMTGGQEWAALSHTVLRSERFNRSELGVLSRLPSTAMAHFILDEFVGGDVRPWEDFPNAAKHYLASWSGVESLGPFIRWAMSGQISRNEASARGAPSRIRRLSAATASAGGFSSIATNDNPSSGLNSLPPSEANPGLEVRPTGKWIRERITDPKTGALTAHAKRCRKDMVADYMDRKERGKPGFYQFMRTQTSGEHRVILGRIRGTGRMEVQSILHPLSEKASLARRYGAVRMAKTNRSAKVGVLPDVRLCPNGCGPVRFNGRRTVNGRRGVLVYDCADCGKTFAPREDLR